MSYRFIALVALLACALAAAAARAEAAPKDLAPVANAIADADPLAYDPSKLELLERNAAWAYAGPLYANSPGGIAETARRVAHWRPQIEKAVAGSGFSPDILEGIVFLESAGRADAIAPGNVNSASGLVQIMGYTANDFLGMNVKVQQSRNLTNQIRAAKARGQHAKARRLEAQRRAIDSRFDPPKALAAAVKYLTVARGYLGRNDLAVASYHMGIGNLQNVLRAYGQSEVPYTQVFFDSSPTHNAAAWDKLVSLSDDSRHYYFKVLAAKRIMHLYRTDRAQLNAISTLHGRKHSHEEVMHPESQTKVFRAPAEIRAAKAAGELLGVPNRPAELHFQISPGMGSLAPGMGVDKRTYRALKPEALAALTYLAQRVQQVGDTKTPLILTSTVRDWSYQSRLMRVNTMAARSYSVHTTGYAFDIARAWNSKKQAAAVQFTIDRMMAHGLIAYIKEPHAIHIAVSKDAAKLVPQMLGDVAEPDQKSLPTVPEHEGEHVHTPGDGHEDEVEPVDPPRAPATVAQPAEAPAPAPAATKAEGPAAEKGGFIQRLKDFLGIWSPDGE